MEPQLYPANEKKDHHPGLKARVAAPGEGRTQRDHARESQKKGSPVTGLYSFRTRAVAICSGGCAGATSDSGVRSVKARAEASFGGHGSAEGCGGPEAPNEVGG